eukprot:gb/GECH01009870.1/.p1 GENE.gb/GECH01009870.1/~~gb/GECH01009870.1/.p1  ORF type:complete len:374 (+),score=101.23 gb/GECH01009870.1/:1-1122(+)
MWKQKWFFQNSLNTSQPLPRSSHAAIVCPRYLLGSQSNLITNDESPFNHNFHHHLIILGGCDENTQFDSIHLLDLDSMKWDSFLKNGQNWNIDQLQIDDFPLQRIGYSYCSFNNHHSLIINGGFDDQFHCDLWLLDIETLTWNQINPSNGTPPGRAHHSINEWKPSYNSEHFEEENKLIVFGGFFEWEYRNDTIVFDFENNKWIYYLTQNEPCPRGRHSACVVSDQLFIFGGENQEGNVLNDLWCLRLESKRGKWISVTTSESRVPHPRFSSASTTLLDRFWLIHGGADSQEHAFNDLWILDLEETHVWHQIDWEHHDSRVLPPHRMQHSLSLVPDVHDEAFRMVLFGGVSGDDFYNDCWELVLTSKFLFSLI